MVEKKGIKRNLDSLDDNEMEQVADDKPPELSGKLFRKGMKGSDGLKCVRNFVNIALNNPYHDIVLEYLEAGGSVQELLSLMDVTAKGDLATALPVFKAVHLVLLKSQSVKTKYLQHAEEGVRYLLHTFMSTIQAMLSMNISKHRKAVLKLLTSFVTINHSFGKEILNSVQFSPTVLEQLVDPTPGKDSLRKSFIHFLLSFLVEKSISSIRTLMNKKVLLNSVFPGLKYDNADTVNLFLSMLKEKLLENTEVPKTSKLDVFNTQIIQSLFELYDWKGPQNIKSKNPIKRKKYEYEKEVKNEDSLLVTESVHSFLLVLCTSKKHGVVFVDKSVGTSGKNFNQLLFTSLESLPRPWENSKAASLVIEILTSCPDLIKPILSKMGPSFQPRESLMWSRALEFIQNLLNSLNIAEILSSSELSHGHAMNVAQGLCAPAVVMSNMRDGIQKSHPLPVRYLSMVVLVLMWEKSQELLQTIKSHTKQLRKTIANYFLKFLPDVDELLSLWQELCKEDFENTTTLLPTPDRSSFLSTILDAFQMTVECSSSAITSPDVFATTLMNSLENAKETLTDEDQTELQIKIVEVLALLDYAFLKPDSELFKAAIEILMRFCKDSSLVTVSKILINSSVFKNKEQEIDIWLGSFLTLPVEYQKGAADVFTDFILQAFQQITGDFETPSEEISPLLEHSLKVISSKNYKKRSTDKLKAGKLYLSNVVVHLLHFYSDKEQLFAQCAANKNIFTDEAWSYLINWANNDFENVNLDFFYSENERNISSYLLNENQSEMKALVQEATNVNLFLLFKMSVFYLSEMAANDRLVQGDAEKYTNCLLAIAQSGLSHGEECDGCSDVLSSSVQNLQSFYLKCLNSLLADSRLLQMFDCFESSLAGQICTDVCIKVIQFLNDLLRVEKIDLVQLWKERFVKQLKTKLKKSKHIEASNIKTILSLFQFDGSQVDDLIKLFCNVQDMDLFATNKSYLSNWSFVLVKMVNQQISFGNVNDETIGLLCKIIQHLAVCADVDLEILDECVVHSLERSPASLVSIKNEFLESTLRRSNINTSTIDCGKLLLSDPKKVRHLIKYALGNEKNIHQWKILLPMLSALIVEDCHFVNILTKNSKNLLWKENELPNKSDFSKLLQLTYSANKSEIIRCMTKNTSSWILDNLHVACLLIKYFLDEKDLPKLKKKFAEGTFQLELSYAAIKKQVREDLVESYLKGSLKMLCELLKSGSYNNWTRISINLSDMALLCKDFDYSQLSEFSEWKNFTRLSLKSCLSSTADPSLTNIFRSFIEIIHKPNCNSNDVSTIFNMIISHSEFLNVMLKSSTSKCEVVKLLHCLVVRNSSVASKKLVPVLLASYSASLTLCDQVILQVLGLYDELGIDTSQYQPFVWGEAAVSHYSVRSNCNLSLWRQVTMMNVLNLLDIRNIEATVTEFPILRTSEFRNISCYNSNSYDPAFLLPLFASLLSPGSVTYCHPFVYKGGLAFTLCSLSSKCEVIRSAASLVLSRFYNHLELTPTMKQKPLWLHFIDCIRFGLEKLDSQPVPTIVSIFWARTTLELSKPPAEMFRPLQNFVLAKSVFNLNYVPEFMQLFHSSDVDFEKHKSWILQVMHDGIKQDIDVELILQGTSLKIMLSYFNSFLCKPDSKVLILKVLSKIMKIKKDILLISEHGLLTWISEVASNPEELIMEPLVELISTIVNLFKSHAENAATYITPLCMFQLMNIITKLVPRFKRSSSAIFKAHLTSLQDCLILYMRKCKNKVCPVTNEKLKDLIDVGARVLGRSNYCWRMTETDFYFRNPEIQSESEDILNRTVYIYNLLHTKKKLIL